MVRLGLALEILALVNGDGLTLAPPSSDRSLPSVRLLCRLILVKSSDWHRRFCVPGGPTFPITMALADPPPPPPAAAEDALGEGGGRG